jgi:hypothetical protein
LLHVPETLEEVPMKARTLGGALLVAIALAVVTPATALADHRHSGSCGHGYSDRGYSRGYFDRGHSGGYYSRGYSDRGYYDRGYYDRDYYDRGYYDPYYRGYSRGSYVPYYAPPRGYYYDRYYAPPPRVVFHYHGRNRCSSPHVGLFLRF